MLHRKRIGIFAVAFMISSPCAADLRPYLFVDGGIADPDLSSIETQYKRMKNEASTYGGNGSINADDTGGAYVIGVGIQPFRHFAMEIGYYDFGSYDIEGTGQYDRGERHMSASGHTRTSIDGWGAQGIFIMPLSERFHRPTGRRCRLARHAHRRAVHASCRNECRHAGTTERH